MNELAPRLTDNGKAYIINALNGDGIVFTKIVLGNGTPAAGPVTAVTAPLIEIGLTNIEIHESFCVLTGKFDNSNVAQGFYMTELGVYAKNTEEEEVLYSYRYQASEVDYIPSSESGNVIETELSVIVSIGDAKDVTAVLIEGSLYATKEELNDHLRALNPHNIDKKTVGLDKVENLIFGENVPTIKDLEEDDVGNVENGDTLDEIVSKLRFWLRKVAESRYIPLSGYGNIYGAFNNEGVTGSIWFADSGKNLRGIGGRMSLNDFWRIVGGGSKSVNPNGTDDANDCGYLEIATADNGSEPIIVRQYSYDNAGEGYTFTKVIRTLYLLDHLGNTKIPGELEFFGGYRGIKWSYNPDPNVVGTTNGDGAYIGLVGNPSTVTDDLEIGVADDGNEQIILRQRRNVGSTGAGIGGNWASIPINRTAYLLNTSGNTIFPGSCTAKSHPTSSDLKKKDVHGNVDLETAEALILGLQPIFYNFKSEWKESAGFGAQDVYRLAHKIGLHDSGLYRAAMMPDKDGNCDGREYHDADIDAHEDKDIEWNLNYTEFIPYMVRVIQDQQIRIRSLEDRLEAFEKKLGGS